MGNPLPGQEAINSLVGPGRINADFGNPLVAGIPVNGGTFVMNGATPVVVADADVSAGSMIIFTLDTVGGTVGAYPAIQTITPGTGFTVAGTAADTSTYRYVILA